MPILKNEVVSTRGFKMRELGKLYVFEGIDGVGKTTLSQRVRDQLNLAGGQCVLMTFPGQEIGSLGRHVYDLHHNPSHFNVREIHPTSRQLLHIAAHIDTIETRILPAIHAGTTVILDRYWWSTWVYGVTYGAAPKSLELMVRAELAHWGTIRPTALFVVQRFLPASKRPRPEDKRLTEEYSKLMQHERKNYPVFSIDNKGTFEETLTQILKYINLTNTVPNSGMAGRRREKLPKRLTRIPRSFRHAKSK